MKDGSPPHADSNHRRRMADNSDNAGAWTTWHPGSAIPANRFQHYRDGRVPHEKAHRQPQGDDENGTAPYPVGHSQQSAYTCSLGLRDTPTEGRRGHRWLFIGWEVDNDEVSYALMGGAIKSPSNVKRFCQACQQGMSRYDTVILAERDYHGGVWGFDPRTIRIIKNCGYTTINSVDIILCYRDIIHLDRKMLEGWTNVRTQHSGPSVERIVEKVMPLFPKHKGIMMADLVHFYNTFQKTGSIYLLPLMLFDAVSLKLGFEGLCPPGLRVDRYASIAAALMEVIP